MAWHGRDVEVRREPGGRPTIAFTGKAAEFAARLGVTRASLSLSHTKDQAIAFCDFGRFVGRKRPALSQQHSPFRATDS